MAVLLHPAFLTLRSPAKMHSSSCSPLYFHPYRQSCQFIIALRLKKKNDSTLKCLGTTGDMAEMFPSSSLIILARDFYEHLNKKDMKKLNELLDNSCMFEDLAFPSPFKDKPAVSHFLEQLSRAMGQNVRFKIDDVFEEGKQNVGARWHLEWSHRVIPFTKGCSFFYCSEHATGLLIKKACVFVESPVKPGAIVLDLLRFVTFFFDKFPKLAVWFLEKPHVLFLFLIKAYRIFVEPLMLPILIYYTQLWRYGTRSLSLVISLIQNILKSFM